ncbi:MAG: WD40 repeat domain-containing protein [Gemmatales bacterium]
MQLRGWSVVCLLMLSLAFIAAQDQSSSFQQEKAEVTASPVAKLFANNVFKKIDSLESQAKQSKEADRSQLLLQQARWLLPETKPSLPEHVSRVMGSLKFKHDQFPTALVYSPDGQSLYTASRDGTVRQWNLQNGRTSKSWDLGQPLSALCLSNNGQYLAACEGYRPSPNLDLGTIPSQEDYAIHVIDLSNGSIKWKLKGTKVPIYCLAFTTDSQQLASGGQAEKSEAIRIWNLTTGKLDRAFKPLQAITNIAWSKDAARLYVTTSDRTFGVFDAKSGLQMQSVRERGAIFAMALSPDESTLAIAGDTTDDASGRCIKLYNTQDWKVSQSLTGHQSSVVALAFHPKGNLLVSASAKPEAAIKVWDLVKKTAITQYLGHTNDVLAVALSSNGDRVASVSLDGSIRLWQTSQVMPGRKLLSGKASIWTVASHGSRILTVSADQSAVLWNSESGKELVRFTEHKSPVTAGVFRPDGNEVATGGGDAVIRLWDPTTGKTNTTLTGHTGVITALAYSPDGKKLYSASADKTVRIWNIAEKKSLHTMEQHRSVVTSLAVNLDGSLLASGGADNIIRIWRTADGSELRSLVGHTGAITGLAFSPGGTLLASVGADGVTRIWDPATRSDALHSLSGHVGQLMAVAFSPNLKYLATAGADETIRIWNLQSFPVSETRALKGHTDWVTSLAYLGDGDSLVSSSVDGSVLVWSETKSFELPVFGHEHPIRYLAISPQGDRLASGSEEGKIILWDTTTGNDLATLSSHQSAVKALSFSNDGRKLVSADRDLWIKLWEVPEGKETQTLKSPSDSINRIAFLGKDRGIVASTGSSNISLWAFDGKQLKVEPALSFLGYERHCNSVAFAQDRVALGSTDGIVKFWKLTDFKQDSDEQLRAYTVAVHELTLSADGKRALTSNQENEFKLWNTDDKKQINSWKTRPAKLSCLAIHAKGELVIAGFETGEVVLWDAKTGKELRSWKFRCLINDLILSPTSKHAYAGTSHGVIYQLDLP